MALIYNDKPRTMRRIRIQIGDEWAEHDFVREAPLSRAREMALHYVECFTGEGDREG